MPSALRYYMELQIHEHYTRELLDRVPGVVHRTLLLSPMPRRKRSPAREIQVYLREATRCCVFGLWQASIALSRAALEAALNEKLEKRLLTACDTLNQRIRAAGYTGILDPATTEMAYKVAKHGNTVLHKGPLGEGEASETVAAMRGVLAYLY
jgi:hypothetical protein